MANDYDKLREEFITSYRTHKAEGWDPEKDSTVRMQVEMIEGTAAFLIDGFKAIDNCRARGEDPAEAIDGLAASLSTLIANFAYKVAENHEDAEIALLNGIYTHLRSPGDHQGEVRVREIPQKVN